MPGVGTVLGGVFGGLIGAASGFLIHYDKNHPPPVESVNNAESSGDAEHADTLALASHIEDLKATDERIADIEKNLGEGNNDDKQKLETLKADIEDHIKQFQNDKRPANVVDRDVLAYSTGKLSDVSDILKDTQARADQAKKDLEALKAQQPGGGVVGGGGPGLITPLPGPGGGEGDYDGYGPELTDALGAVPGMLSGLSPAGLSGPGGAGLDSGIASAIPGLVDAIQGATHPDTDPGDNTADDPDGSAQTTGNTDNPAPDPRTPNQGDPPGAAAAPPAVDPATLVTLPDGTPVTAPSAQMAAVAKAYLSGAPLSPAAEAAHIGLPHPTDHFAQVNPAQAQAFDVAVYKGKPYEMLTSATTGMLNGQPHTKHDLIAAPGFAGFFRPKPSAPPAVATPEPSPAPPSAGPSRPASVS